MSKNTTEFSLPLSMLISQLSVILFKAKALECAFIQDIKIELLPYEPHFIRVICYCLNLVKVFGF